MNKNSISFILAIVICLLFGSYYFIDSFKFMMPYGYDEILTVWPIGRALSESSYTAFPKMIISSFLSEDHLFPINGIVSYFIYSKKSDPLLILSWATKVLYLAIIILTIILTNNLWKNKHKNIIALILMIFSQSMFFGNLGYNMNFNLVAVIALLTIILFLKYIESKNNKTLYILLGITIIGTLTFESYFVIYPIILGLAIILMFDKQVVYFNALKVVGIYCLFLLTLLPYLIIHYILYGRLLPGSRLTIIGNGSLLKNFMKVGLSFFNDFFFNVPKYIEYENSFHIQYLFPVAVIFFILFICFKKGVTLTKYGYAFLSAFIISLGFIMYTGRYHPGLWVILGIVGLIVFADIFYNFLIKLKLTEYQTNVCLILFCFLLYGINSVTKPYEKMKDTYMHVVKESNSAYELIGSPNGKIVVIRLPGGEELMHPIAFWLGNKIYNKDYALQYSNKYYSMHMYGINIEQYENNSNFNFSYFKNVQINSNAVILFKNRNSYFKFDSTNKSGYIFKAIIIPASPADSFDVYIPDFILGSNKKIKIELEFDNKNTNVSKVIFGNSEFKNFMINENIVSFETERYGEYNKLKFELIEKNSKNKLRKIRVSSQLSVQYENIRNDTVVNLPFDQLTLKYKADLFFSIHEMNQKGIAVFGSLNQNIPNSKFVFTRFLDSNTLLEIKYWSPDLHISKTVSNVRVLSKTPIELLP